MKIAIVKAVSREGYSGYWAAGRKWPSDSPRIIEVLDDEDDRPAPIGFTCDQESIGQKSLRMIESEGCLSVNLREIDSLEDIELVNGAVTIKKKNAPVEKTKGDVSIHEKPTEKTLGKKHK